MHVLGGYHEIERLTWDEQPLTLSGCCRRMPGVSGRLYLYVPDRYRPRTSSLTHVGGPLWCAELAFDEAQAEFSLPFDRSGK